MSTARSDPIHPPRAPGLIAPRTVRLQLRQWRAEDLSPFAALNADARVMAHFPAPLTRAQSDAMAARCEALIAARGWGFWAVELQATQQFIGMVGLHIPRAELPCSPCVEIGWRLAFAHWGQGLAQEAARAALAVGFEVLHLPEIVAFTAQRNGRSQALMQRLGMQPSGGFEHPDVPQGHPLRPHVLYRLSHALWPRQPQATLS